MAKETSMLKTFLIFLGLCAPCVVVASIWAHNNRKPTEAGRTEPAHQRLVLATTAAAEPPAAPRVDPVKQVEEALRKAMIANASPDMAPATPRAELPPVVIPEPIPELPDPPGPDPQVNPLERRVKSRESLGSIMRKDGIKCEPQRKPYRAVWRRMNHKLVARNREAHRNDPTVSIYRVRHGDKMLTPMPSELAEILRIPCK